jgi:tyrosinase
MSNVDKTGIQNRADDFTVSHINQTNFIHNSGLLLPWHRQYIWAYEQELRTRCAYNGSLPYVEIDIC